jgi:hypothetical protein
MIEIGRIQVEEHPPSYNLRNKIEKLYEFLLLEGKQIKYFDVIAFLAEEVFIFRSYRDPVHCIHERFLVRAKFTAVNQLPPYYLQFYHLLVDVFASSNEEDVHSAVPYLLEKLSALALSWQREGNAINNCKFYVKNGTGRALLRMEYTDGDGQTRHREEVDVLVHKCPQMRNGILAECKRSAGGYKAHIGHTYGFLCFLKDKFLEHGNVESDIYLVVPEDRSDELPRQIGGLTVREKDVHLMYLRKWKTKPRLFPAKS